jgi:flagellar biosynthesis protein FlhA
LSELAGEETNEPAFGLPALWIDRSFREDANFRGLTVVDASTVITTHLTEVLKDNVSDLFSYAETQKLLRDLPEEAQKLVTDLVPSKISVSSIQRVLQNLLSESVSIRDLATILEGIAEAVGYTQNIMMITEHVRARLARQISSVNTREGTLPVVMLSPDWEQRFGDSLIANGDDRQLAMSPSDLQGFIADVRDVFDRLAMQGEMPCLLTSPIARPYVRSIIERVRPATVVLSQNEIHPRAKIRALGSV